MRSIERIIWITLLTVSLLALGVSILYAKNLQQVFDREQFLHLMGTAGLVKQIEAGELDQAISNGRIYIRAYGGSYILRNPIGRASGNDAEKEAVMEMLQRDFPDLLASIEAN